MPHRLVRYGGPVIAVLLFTAALWVLHRELAGERWRWIAGAVPPGAGPLGGAAAGRGTESALKG
jgi:hypothetical protein